MRRLYNNRRMSKLHEDDYEDDDDDRYDRRRLRDFEYDADEEDDAFDDEVYDEEEGIAEIGVICDNLGVDWEITKSGREVEIYISDMVWIIVNYNNRTDKVEDIRITLQNTEIKCKTNTTSAENACDELTTAVMVIKDIKEKMR